MDMDCGPTSQMKTASYRHNASEDEKGIRAGDSCYAWCVALASFMCNNFVFGVLQAIGPLLVAVQYYFDESSARVSWILALTIFLACALGPLSNVCVKKVGFRATVMIGTITSSTGFFISAFATHLEVLYVSIGCLVGIGYGLIIPAHLGILPHYIKKRFTVANSLVMTGSGVGTFVFPLLLQFLIDFYGWKGAVMIFSAVNAHMAISAAVYRCPVKVETALTEDDEKAEPPRDNRCCANGVCQACDLTIFARYPKFITFFLTSFFAVGVGLQGLPAHLFARGKTKNLGTDEQMALVVSIFAIGSIIGRWLPPVLYLLTRRWNNTILFASSIVLAGVISLISPLSASYSTYAGYAFVVGFLLGVAPVLGNLVITDIVGAPNFTAGIGFHALAISVGGLIGPPLAGYIYDETGDYNNSFYFYGAFTTFGGLIMLAPEFYRPKRKMLQHTNDH